MAIRAVAAAVVGTAAVVAVVVASKAAVPTVARAAPDKAVPGVAAKRADALAFPMRTALLALRVKAAAGAATIRRLEPTRPAVRRRASG